MARVNLLLFALVMGSALYLVRTQYESRLLYTALDRAVADARRLDEALSHHQLPSEYAALQGLSGEQLLAQLPLRPKPMSSKTPTAT